MPALTEVQSILPLPASKSSNRPICKICSDSMISPEVSTLSDREVSYLWSCETCGYGFVTTHTVKPFACN
ncbi:MAG: hypothetical protein NTZ72_13235 [Afipia sp.]|nr:hypothetical protein [Afipia sp.]